ncbi:hypothetical protein I316_01318 [Kwoniella heveanensis BCC8398]|uniref:Uncharacterized protein n=1 Tax=Kwoniella heveanensis BCC8398 TaxID=1296120 RepID=A0A1B9H0C5_9TREE|nr:hypothetical protein I316_01318 [Kwoniella heveanensis BCC8398]
MSDPRFARLKTDPRFRRPKQKDLKVEIDDRFRDVLESEEFGGKGKGRGKASARVDARGRPLTSSHHADQLKRFYRLRSPEKGDDAEGEGEGFVDYARGEGALYSSGSEDGSDAESEVEEEELELGGKRKSRIPGHVTDSENDSDEDDSEDGEDHLKIDLSENEAESAFPPEADEDGEEEEDESVPPTTRIAAVNLDWDNLRAADLYAVFNSFLLMASSKASAGGNAPEGSKSGSGSGSAAALGKLLNVKIYPSEFGKERMAREEQEGPGGGIFVSKHGDKQSKKKSHGPKEAIVLQKHQRDAGEDEFEEGSEEEDEGEESEEDLLDEGEGSDDPDDDEEESGEDEEEFESGEEDDDAPAPRSNDKPGREIDGLEIISDVESEAGSEDIDMDQLRQYQLERLRYFYAIATFSTVAASEYVMNECNGTEFERTANIMDLSYVPEGMEFADDEIRDEATKEPKGYKGNDFVTDALRHSKVKLTWDQDDPNRVKMTRRTLTREEIEEQDFNNLVASSGSELSDDDDDDNFDEVNGTGTSIADGKKGEKGKAAAADKKKSKKAAMKERTAKLRELLLAGDDEGGDIWGKAGTAWADELEEIKNPKSGKGKEKEKQKPSTSKSKKEDMEITFKPGLSNSLGGAGAEEENMTSLERYQLRMKEKRARKKEKMELKRAAREGSDSDSGSGSGSEDEKKGKGQVRAAKKKNDDFFGSDSDGDREGDVVSDTGFDEDADIHYAAKAKAVSSKTKAKPTSSTEASKTDPKSNSKSTTKPKVDGNGPADISALVGKSDRPDTNFSMKDILKSEKEESTKRRKRRRPGSNKKGADADGDEKELGPEGWKIDVKDNRFKALHEDAEFAIDPSNPHFTKTKAMQDLLAERTRIRQSKNKSTSNRPEAEGLRSATGIKREAGAGAGAGGARAGDEGGEKEKDLSDLVQSVKRKMGEGGGKRKRHRK